MFRLAAEKFISKQLFFLELVRANRLGIWYLVFCIWYLVFAFGKQVWFLRLACGRQVYYLRFVICYLEFII
jgi:hypothetical protein